MNTVLRAESLNKVYKLGGLFHRLRIRALDNVNLEVKSDKPTIVSLVGESGSGKTTLAKVLLRLVEPTSGRAFIYDRLVAGRDKAEKPTKRDFLSTVQPIFQNPFEAFSSYRTVDSYLLGTAAKVSQLTQAQAVDAVEEALVSVGLKYRDVRGKYPNQFSGGELQRVSIARALIPRPRIIIADEPVSMIDASLRMSIINLFLRLKQEYNTSFLYITHDLATAYYTSDSIAVMYRGCIVEFGSAKAVLTSPRHPYTRLLLESIPLTNRKWQQERIALAAIEAREYQFTGCRYCNRCSFAEEECVTKRPPLVLQEDGRQVACHFVGEAVPTPLARF